MGWENVFHIRGFMQKAGILLAKAVEWLLKHYKNVSSLGAGMREKVLLTVCRKQKISLANICTKEPEINYRRIPLPAIQQRRKEALAKRMHRQASHA